MITNWPLDAVLGTGDAATSTTALSELYESMGGEPSAPDPHGLCVAWEHISHRVSCGSATAPSRRRVATSLRGE